MSQDSEIVHENVGICHSVRQPEDVDEVCAICFEQKVFVELPCVCRSVRYCAACWDRCLVVGLNAAGQARCPSCRVVISVDFEPQQERIVFSMAEVDATSLDQADVEEGEKIEAAKSDDWRLRLYSKTRPVQIGLLREHGLSRAAAAAWPSQSCTAPMCLCGGELERLDVRTRILRMLEAADSAWRSRVPESQVEPMIAHLARSPLVTCDLCSKVATITGVVWSCGNGTNTLLHPSAYDVCECCFAEYTGTGLQRECAPECNSSSSSSSDGFRRSTSDDRFAQSCCHPAMYVLAQVANWMRRPGQPSILPWQRAVSLSRLVTP